MNLRTLRHRTARRYLGPTDHTFGDPVNLAMIDRFMRRSSRQVDRRYRRTPRPLHAYLRGRPHLIIDVMTGITYDRRTGKPPKPARPTTFEQFNARMRANFAEAFTIPRSMMLGGA